MKKLFLAAMVLFFSEASYADVYVVTAPDKSVYSVSEQNDAVIPQGYSVKRINGSIAQLGLVRDPSFYKFEGNRFNADVQKIKAVDDAIIASQRELEAQKALRQSAINKLKSIGLSEEEISSLISQ